MANEIWHNYPEGNNLDVYIFKKTADEVFDQADGGDTFEAWNDANVLNYDNPMTDHGGDYYSVDFPAVITTAGVYSIAIAVRAGGTAAVGDKRIAQGEISWDGTAEIDTYTGSVDLTDIEDKIDILDTNLDQLIIDQNRVLNVVDETEEPPSLQITVE